MAGKPGRSGGRNAVPTALKVLRGNPGRRPLNEEEPQFPAGEVEAPDWLDPLAIALWNQLAPRLSRAGLLSIVDVPLLAAACERWSIYRRAARRTRRSLTQMTKAGGRQPVPELGIAKGALTDLFSILREFGVGPSSRSRLRGAAPPEATDPFEDFIANG